MSITNLEDFKNAWGKYVQEKEKIRKEKLRDEMKKSLDAVDGAREFLLKRLEFNGVAIKFFHKSERSSIIATALSKGISFGKVEALLYVDISIAEDGLKGCKTQTVEKVYTNLLKENIAYIAYGGKKKWDEVCALCKKILK